MGDSGISGRAAALAVAVAFAVGIVASLAVRPPGSESEAARATSSTAEARIRWLLPVSFGTNWPALGDNVIYVTDAIARASGGEIELLPSEPGEIVPAFSISLVRRRDFDVASPPGTRLAPFRGSASR